MLGITIAENPAALRRNSGYPYPPSSLPPGEKEGYRVINEMSWGKSLLSPLLFPSSPPPPFFFKEGRDRI